MTTETAPQVDFPAPAAKEAKRPRVRLGEELPIFCERCGYSLYGLPQGRCERCTILHFVCPECNHHQPINTIRPAFQRILGRMRAFVLLVVVLFKLNLFFWPLFGWCAFGYESSYHRDYRQVTLANGQRTWQGTEYRPRLIDDLFRDEEMLVGLTVLAFGFGLVERMFLLRWRRGFFVGAVLGALAVFAFVLGALFRQWERAIATSPFNWDFIVIAAYAATLVIVGASIAWPLWSGFVRLVTPRETADAFLEWQRGLSRKTATLARE
jgi:hypothetical protein